MKLTKTQQSNLAELCTVLGDISDQAELCANAHEARVDLKLMQQTEVKLRQDVGVFALLHGRLRRSIERRRKQ